MKIMYLNGPFRRLPYSRCSRSPAVTKSGTIYYPFWLAYAAGWASRNTPYDIELLDAVARRWDIPELLNYLHNSPPDLVFCDTSTPSIREDLNTVRVIKTAFPHCRVILVGTHVSALAEEILSRHGYVDGIARGEYDDTAVDLAGHIEAGKSWETVRGLSYRCAGEVRHNEDRPLMQNLDLLPFAGEIYNRFLHIEDYFFAAAQYPMIMTITSRGCPHRCAWCLYPQVMHRGKYRTRSAASVAEEFDYISRELPHVREVGIEDDLFTGDRKRVGDIARRLIRQNNRLHFWCDTRVDLDLDTMCLLKEAGCRLLIAGFESASQDILDGINKGIRAEQSLAFMENARRAGLLVHGCFVLGNPGETLQTMHATLEFAKKLNPDTAQFFPMMVYPGTALYSWARDNDYLRTEDYGCWLSSEGLHDSIIDMPQLSGREVMQFCRYARKEFYLRRGYIVRKLLQSIMQPQEARRNIKAFRTFAKHLVGSR